MACNPCTRWLGLCNAAKEESRKCKPHAIGKTTEVFRLHLACKKISVQHAETFCKLSALHKVGVVSFCFISALARASLILEYVAFVKCFMLKRTAGFLSHEASDNGLKTIFESHFFFSTRLKISVQYIVILIALSQQLQYTTTTATTTTNNNKELDHT